MFDNDIFRTIKAFSPTGKMKRLPYTKYNKMRYERFLYSMKSYLKQAAHQGKDVQELALRAIPDEGSSEECDSDGNAVARAKARKYSTGKCNKAMSNLVDMNVQMARPDSQS